MTYNVLQFFDSQLEKIYKFDTYEEAEKFYEEMHKKTKSTFFIRYKMNLENIF
jgi:hypothetical protein